MDDNKFNPFLIGYVISEITKIAYNSYAIKPHYYATDEATCDSIPEVHSQNIEIVFDQDEHGCFNDDFFTIKINKNVFNIHVDLELKTLTIYYKHENYMLAEVTVSTLFANTPTVDSVLYDLSVIVNAFNTI